MSPVTGRDLGISLCRALGLDLDRVTGLSVTCEGQGLAKVTVGRYVTDAEAEAIATVLSEYTLEPLHGDDELHEAQNLTTEDLYRNVRIEGNRFESD